MPSALLEQRLNVTVGAVKRRRCVSVRQPSVLAGRQSVCQLLSVLDTRKPKMPPHVRFETRCSISTFSNFDTRFSLATCCMLATRSGEGRGAQRMMGTHNGYSSSRFPPILNKKKNNTLCLDDLSFESRCARQRRRRDMFVSAVPQNSFSTMTSLRYYTAEVKMCRVVKARVFTEEMSVCSLRLTRARLLQSNPPSRGAGWTGSPRRAATSS